MGIEPTTYSLGSCRSTTELRPRPAQTIGWGAAADKPSQPARGVVIGRGETSVDADGRGAYERGVHEDRAMASDGGDMEHASRGARPLALGLSLGLAMLAAGGAALWASEGAAVFAAQAFAALAACF